MAEVKISSLTAATGLTDDDVLIVNDGATTKKISVTDTRRYMGGFPNSGAIGDSGASFDNTNATKYRPWNQVWTGEYATGLTIEGRVAGGAVYLREVADIDSISYRVATAKSSGTAYFVAYELDDDNLPTGAPIWTHEIADVTSTASVTETGLTPVSISGGWYWLGVWNPSDSGGNINLRCHVSSGRSGLFDPNNPDYSGMNYAHSANTAPATLAGTETWIGSQSGPPAIGVLDSTS